MPRIGRRGREDAGGRGFSERPLQGTGGRARDGAGAPNGGPAGGGRPPSGGRARGKGRGDAPAPAKPPRKGDDKSLGYKIFYAISLVVIALIWGFAFRSYFRHYDSRHPEITWALPYIQTEYAQADGVLLWDEELLKTPRAGTVTYPLGPGPIRVFKGAIVARVKSAGKTYDIKARDEGYFIAGADGLEGKWRYSSLWLGSDELPECGEVTMYAGGVSRAASDIIGKIVPQPQQARFIGYADASAGLERKLSANNLRVRVDPLDTASRVMVGVYERYDHKLKMYLRLPWFPPEMLMSRATKLFVETGGVSGVVVPDTAVIMKGGGAGVYVIKGSNAVFQKVEGRAIDSGRFLVTSGMRLGDAVAVYADKAVEGRVNLW